MTRKCDLISIRILDAIELEGAAAVPVQWLGSSLAAEVDCWLQYKETNEQETRPGQW